MASGFWSTLPRPFFALGPMSNLTDAPMRRMIARYGKADVSFTEFVSVAGLCSRGRSKLLPDLYFCEQERPVVAQFFGREPKQFFKAAALARELGFDGVDVNCGCPDKSILKQGAGSNLINDPPLVREIVAACREGSGLPVSVKTRTGYLRETIDSWIPALLDCKPDTITLHGRTRNQKYLGNADWEVIRRAAAMVRGNGTVFIGNGDVRTRAEGLARAAESGADGIMIARAIIGNPWVFNPDCARESLSQQEILEAMLEHARYYEEIFGSERDFINMRKNLKSYVSGFPGARRLRWHLVRVDSLEETRQIVHDYLTGQLQDQEESPSPA